MKLIFPLAAALAFALTACATTPAAEEMVTVTGEATYRERIALPPEAVMTVRIEDVSRADASAPVLAEESYLAEGRQVPLPFAVEVPRAALEGAITTSARVRIEDADGRLMWITDMHTQVTAVAGKDLIDLGTLVMVRTPG